MDRKNKADKLFLGNIITLDSRFPVFEALTVKDGKVQYIGSRKLAEKLCDEETVVMDYGNNYIYPGMIEAHCHPEMAGSRLAVQCDLSAGECLRDYVDIMKEFISRIPDATQYLGAGWITRDETPDSSMLDEMCPDKPVYLNSADGHSMWMNTAALRIQGIDEEEIKKWGTDVIRVDADGKPTGYISEGPVNSIMKKIMSNKEDTKRGLLAWQDFAFRNGYTACLNAGASHESLQAMKELIDEGKWKLRTYAVYLCNEDDPDYVAVVRKAVDAKEKYNCEYSKVIGMKVFMDGVIEAHTGWLKEPYCDEKGGHGVQRLSDHDRFVDLLREAEKNGFNVHCHTIGDGAIDFALDAIEQVQLETGNMNMRNALAHLQIVRYDQIQRIVDNNVVAVVAPLWSPYIPDYQKQEYDYVGKERSWDSYPVRSFYDKHAIVAFHTDYPVSPEVNIPLSIYTALFRNKPGFLPEQQRKADECISIDEAISGLTTGPAYSVFEENELGQLMIGYVANMTIYDTDFYHADPESIPDARLVATVVDGEEVYRAE